MKPQIACLALFVALSFSGCSTISNLMHKAKPQPPINANKPYNTETYWAQGKKPKNITAQVKSEAGIISFYDSSTGKEAGFTKFAAFGQIKNGKYKFDRIADDTASFVGESGNLSISSTNPSATIYVPQEGFLIFRGYANQQMDIEVVNGQAPDMTASSQIARALPVSPIDRQMPQHRLGDLSTLPDPNLNTLDQRLSESPLHPTQ